ncbi:MAG TPA: protease pro-enzyme activation domain-containing protein, partial [Ktedonobacterales bacterium]|nr:protease pro-enzyme activation domain-containing protein [Ktedonobacterales bacterium]
MHRIVAIALAVAVLSALVADSAPTPAQQALRTVHIGPLPPSFPLEIALVLRGQHSEDLSALLAAEDDPQSSLYHHYLSSTTFAQLYGPSAENEAHVIQVLHAAGFQVENNNASGSLLMAQGTARAVEQLFDVSLDQYRTPQGMLYYLARSQAHIPAMLVDSVSGVLGLDSRNQIETHPLL